MAVSVIPPSMLAGLYTAIKLKMHMLSGSKLVNRREQIFDLMFVILVDMYPELLQMSLQETVTSYLSGVYNGELHCISTKSKPLVDE